MDAIASFVVKKTIMTSLARFFYKIHVQNVAVTTAIRTVATFEHNDSYDSASEKFVLTTTKKKKVNF